MKIFLQILSALVSIWSVGTARADDSMVVLRWEKPGPHVESSGVAFGQKITRLTRNSNFLCKVGSAVELGIFERVPSSLDLIYRDFFRQLESRRALKSKVHESEVKPADDAAVVKLGKYDFLEGDDGAKKILEVVTDRCADENWKRVRALGVTFNSKTGPFPRFVEYKDNKIVREGLLDFKNDECTLSGEVMTCTVKKWGRIYLKKGK